MDFCEILFYDIQIKPQTPKRASIALNLAQKPKRASIFITCLIDNLFPGVGVSMVNVLRRVGVEVDFLDEQTCCGQPAFNSGYRGEAKALAERFISVFEGAPCVVCPSGSCASMVKIFYRDLFKDDPRMLRRADDISHKTYEFSQFLVNVLGVEDVGASYGGRVTYHDSCHLLRELGAKDEPRRLIRAVRGAQLVEMSLNDACCGFGGTFSVKFPDVSAAMLGEKLESIAETGAKTVVSTDMGCLMQIGGAISRRKLPIRAMHLAELLDSRG
ncbi:MAG: (Fe-S)-binding protein [Deltaproteobacteria bacterium]